MGGLVLLVDAVMLLTALELLGLAWWYRRFGRGGPAARDSAQSLLWPGAHGSVARSTFGSRQSADHAVALGGRIFSCPRHSKSMAAVN